MVFRVGTTRDLMTASGEPVFSEAVFEELGRNPEIEWEWMPEDLTEITPEVAARYDGLHINLPRVTADSVGRADCRVKIIARNGVGFDTVDVAACAAKGITVTNTPLAIRRPVAVAALTLIFAVAGKLFTKDKLVREGRWNDRVEHMGLGLTGRTLGLVGAGGIGQELIPLARPFFNKILAADPYVGAEVLTPLGAAPASLDEVLSKSDFLVVLTPLNEETHHLINAEAFTKMRPTACFLNVARGPIHDEAALCAALESHQIAFAALDVTEDEPISPDSPLLTMENTIITPHALCWTDECFADIARTALRSIVDVSLGVTPKHPVG